MLQQNPQDNIKHASTGTVSTGFSIDVNESMFQMLTSKVYNDPILAVIREWSTNACDACIEGGKDINFDVHIPTNSEMYFSVRDYGTGLHPDDIVGLFSTLGASTKRNSDKLNGTFGIGRMAGLAVSSGFSIESYYKGTLYSYAISVQKGVPVTISLGQNPTTEPDGLKLSVAVEAGDVRHYFTKAENLYLYFDHKPNLNLNDLKITLDKSEHISDNWYIKKADDYYNRTNYVVMSQVPYAIPEDSKIRNHDFRNLVIKVEPGSVSFNPGRESLSLDKETVEFINETFDSIKDEYIHASILAMSEGTTDKEIYSIYHRLYTSAPYAIKQAIDPNPFYSKYIQTLNDGNDNFNLRCTTEFKTLCNDKLTLNSKDAYYKHSKSLEEAWVSITSFLTSSHVIIDVKTKFKEALSLEFKSNAAIYWQRKDKVEISELLEEAKTALDALGLSYQLASDIIKKHEDELTSTVPNVPREGFYASRLCNYNHGSFVRSTKLTDSQITEKTYLYIKLHNTTPLLEHSNLNIFDYISLYKVLDKVQSMPEIRGVAKKYQHVADSLDNWLPFEDFMAEVTKNTKIKVPLPVDTIYINTDVISTTSLHLYPDKLQDYFTEVKNYEVFNQGSDYEANKDMISILETLEAPLYSYVPSIEVDMEELNKIFPKTLTFFSMFQTRFENPSQFVSDIAKLEEFYAVHSTQ